MNVADAFRQPPITISAWLTATRADATSNAYALTPFPPSAVSGDMPSEGGYGLGLNVWTDGVDGNPTTQTSANVPPPVTPTPLHIGCHNDDAGYGTKRFYKGIMRDVRIFKRVLSDQDVAQLFSNGPV